MKTLRILFFVLVAVSMSLSSSAQSTKTVKQKSLKDSKKVEVFYFHLTSRCITCKAVEKVSKEAVKELYGNKVSFASYNLDEPTGKKKGKELGVAGQTLLVVGGGKKINLTNEGFLNARSNPEKLKQIIKSKVDPLI